MWTYFFSITGLCFTQARNVSLIAITHLLQTPVLHFSIGESQAQEGARRSEGWGWWGWWCCYTGGGQKENRGSFESTLGDNGVSVFGLARFHPSLPLTLTFHSLSQELLLIKPICFGQLTLALNSNTLALTSALRYALRSTHTCTQFLLVLAASRCHLAEPLNAKDQPNTPQCLLSPTLDSFIHINTRRQTCKHGVPA